MAETQKIVILDFGGQYTQLIARRVRECKVYSEVLPYHAPAAQIRALNPKGIILSGGPASVLEENAPRCDKSVWELGVPVLTEDEFLALLGGKAEDDPENGESGEQLGLFS